METKTITPVANRLMMLTINVNNIVKSKMFYSDVLGFNVTSDYRINDDNWWVSLAFPHGGAALTLARSGIFPESVRTGMLSLYFESSDVTNAHKALKNKGIEVNNIQNDLFGPGSDVKFFNFKDPDGNLIHMVQAHESGIPF